MNEWLILRRSGLGWSIKTQQRYGETTITIEPYKEGWRGSVTTRIKSYGGMGFITKRQTIAAVIQELNLYLTKHNKRLLVVL